MYTKLVQVESLPMKQKETDSKMLIRMSISKQANFEWKISSQDLALIKWNYIRTMDTYLMF